MLATGNSSVAAIDLKESGAKNIRFMCLLAAPEGVKRMQEAHPDVQIVTAALDSHLNEKGYIVPGLGMQEIGCLVQNKLSDALQNVRLVDYTTKKAKHY